MIQCKLALDAHILHILNPNPPVVVAELIAELIAADDGLIVAVGDFVEVVAVVVRNHSHLPNWQTVIARCVSSPLPGHCRRMPSPMTEFSRPMNSSPIFIFISHKPLKITNMCTHTLANWLYFLFP